MRIVVVSLVVFLCVSCCQVSKEAANALSGAWVLIEPDAVAGMEARIDRLTDRSEEERTQLKATERRHMAEFSALIEEVKTSAAN